MTENTSVITHCDFFYKSFTGLKKGSKASKWLNGTVKVVKDIKLHTEQDNPSTHQSAFTAS